MGGGVSQEGQTALISAATSGHVEVVRLLLARGAEVNKADKVGNARE